MKKIIMTLFVSLFWTVSFATESVPKFSDYPVSEMYMGKNHPLVMDEIGKEFKTRLKDAIKNEKSAFAGHYLIVGWGCGTGGCNTGAIIDAITGKAYLLPVALASVYPLKKEFENESGQEHIYKLNSRLMIFAGDIDTSEAGGGDDKIEFYEFKDGKFSFIKSMPYGKKGVSE
ncbi:hypothetical protein [Methyloglobulus sp.]|uniref:hypothetical protein n=1 Tax=Methyloglobulus sp. TaxID=2518622 RepID=UPI0032B782B9